MRAFVENTGERFFGKHRKEQKKRKGKSPVSTGGGNNCSVKCCLQLRSIIWRPLMLEGPMQLLPLLLLMSLPLLLLAATDKNMSTMATTAHTTTRTNAPDDDGVDVAMPDNTTTDAATTNRSDCDAVAEVAFAAAATTANASLQRAAQQQQSQLWRLAPVGCSVPDPVRVKKLQFQRIKSLLMLPWQMPIALQTTMVNESSCAAWH